MFLSLGEILEIHRDQIERYGGGAGLRDIAQLQSAAAMPAARFGGRYLHEDLFEMAAAYLFYIARDHPFVDGNKRTGAVAALVFLSLNGVDIKAAQNALVDIVASVADGTASKAAAAEFFRKHARV